MNKKLANAMGNPDIALTIATALIAWLRKEKGSISLLKKLIRNIVK